MQKRNILNILIILLLIGIGIYRYRNRSFTESTSKIIMGTIVEISLTGSSTNTFQILDDTVELMNKYDKKFSYYNPAGELSAINNSKSEENHIDSEFYELLKIAEEYYYKTNGLYDVTVGVLTDLWSTGRTYPPPADSISYALKLTGFPKLAFTEKKLSKPIGMKINLGSIAKGYIIDKAVEYALANGIENGLINAGGDIRVFGERKKPIRLGVQHPRYKDELIDSLELYSGAVLTSGDYERYFEYEGKKYHHIIDPTTGYPLNNNISVTVIAPTATEADVIATSTFLLPHFEGIDLVKSHPNVECIIFYEENNEIISLRTEGIKNYIINKGK